MSDDYSFPGLRAGDILKFSLEKFSGVDGLDVGEFLVISTGKTSSQPSFKLTDEAACIGSNADELGVRVAQITHGTVELRVISALENDGAA